MGQSQRTLPRVPATRTLPRKITHPPTRRRAHIDDKTLCLNATQNAHTHKFRVATRRITVGFSGSGGAGKTPSPENYFAGSRRIPSAAKPLSAANGVRRRYAYHSSC